MFLEIMRDIEKEQKNGDGFLEQAKILVISHDISFAKVSVSNCSHLLVMYAISMYFCFAV